MTEKRTLLKGGTVLSVDKKVGNFHQGDVLMEGTKIAAVGLNLTAADAEVVDASNTIVMPGFVDTHRHVWEGILRNIGVDVPLEGDASYLAFILNTIAPSIAPKMRMWATWSGCMARLMRASHPFSIGHIFKPRANMPMR